MRATRPHYRERPFLRDPSANPTVGALPDLRGVLRLRGGVHERARSGPGARGQARAPCGGAAHIEELRSGWARLSEYAVEVKEKAGRTEK